MIFKKKIDKVVDLNEFFAGKRILIINDHEYEDAITNFVEMVNLDGTTADPEARPVDTLRMKVTTQLGRPLILEQRNIFVINDVAAHNPSGN